MAELKPPEGLKNYEGNCHCGAFKFSIQIPELTSVTECNCSICFKKGYKWVFPGAGCVIIEKGEGILKEYEFGERSMVHKFCPTCGVGVMGQRNSSTPGMDIAVNARTLQETDLWSLRVHTSDGNARKPFYQPPAFMGPEPSAEIEESKRYTGSCHCGAVTIALKNMGPLVQEVAPLANEIEPEVIGECDCSICARLGRILTYRSPDQISLDLGPGTELSSYSFGSKQFEHKFCPVCGVAVGVDDVIENMKAVNLRCFEGVEWGYIETYKHRGSKEEPMYVVPGYELKGKDNGVASQERGDEVQEI